MKIKLEKHHNIIIVSLLALVFFLATASFNYTTQDADYVKWSSPDETANYFFAKHFAETGQLSFFDPAAVSGDNMVMPRSFRSDFGWLKPVSFLGIILLYGSLAKVLSIAVIPFLTPFFAALGIIIFYLLIQKVFSKRVALLSSFVLASFPVYIYYTVRSMFHNVLFIVLLIIAMYFLALSLGDKKEKIKRKFFSFKLGAKAYLSLLFAFLGGAFVGLSVITRTSELLWLAPVLFLMWIFYARRWGVIKLILSLAGLFLVLTPVIYWNQILYTSPVYGGYNEMNRSLDDLSYSSGAFVQAVMKGDFQQFEQYFDKVKANIFYFGFKSEQSIAMFQHYVVEMFPILLYVSLLGLLLLIVQNIYKFKRKHLLYFLALIILSVILVFYYGSWRFNDNPNPNHFTIGNSYTRYWLPIYLMMMPLAALALVRVSRALVLMDRNSKHRLKALITNGLQATAILLFSASSIIFVMYGSEEGIAHLYYNNKMERVTAEKVFSLTEPGSIIITRYHDKFLFPERRVIMGVLPNEEIFVAVNKLVQKYPIYYYNFFLDEDDVRYLNERKLSNFDFKIQLVEKFNTRFGLYQLVVNNNKADE